MNLILVPASRHCTIQPRVIGPWVCTTTSTSPAHALFKYYIAIDDLSNENSLEEACVGPLLRLLGNNAASSEHPFQVGGEIAYPVCSSEVQAMTLGFFAFKRMDLKLVRIEYPGLITTEPAISHPMGAFWMLPLETLSKYRDWKTVQLNYAPFQMCMTWLTEDCYSSEDLYKDAMTTNLKKRKSALIAEVAELKDALNMKQAELASIENSLSSDR